MTAGDIARAAGVAHGTFYVHFANKEAIADDLLARFNARFATRLQPVIAAALPGAGPGASVSSLSAIVRAVAEHFVDHWRAERDFVRIYAERTASGLDVAALSDGINPPMLDLLQGLLTRVMGSPADGASMNVGLVTHGLLGLWLRVGLQHVLAGRGDRETAISTLTHLTVGALTTALPGVTRPPEPRDV